jgi:hypothetical protein
MIKTPFFLSIFILITACSNKPQISSRSPGQSSFKNPENIAYISLKSNKQKLDKLSSRTLLIKVSEKENKGFNFPYYLLIPREIKQNSNVYLYVEPNNTGYVTDDLNIHDKSAKNLILRSYPNEISKALNVPLLIPVFPRPKEQAHIYTHALDRDSLFFAEKELKRIDLQLINMIHDAQSILRANGIKINDKVLMHGFSASGNFVNRFATLHPDIVKAVACGGVNGIPILPLNKYKNHNLIYPIGISDIKQITGKELDKNAYKNVAQFIYMGALDQNDTLPFSECFDAEEKFIITNLIGAKMMPNRWDTSIEIYRKFEPQVQLVTYEGTSHEIKPEIKIDIENFFRSNLSDKIVKITPHKYKKTPKQELKKVHIENIFWKGSASIPDQGNMRNLIGDGHFIITISEWLKDQNYQQLSDFRDNAGFTFKLVSTTDNSSILITEHNSIGTMNTLDNDKMFKGFVVRLDDNQLYQIKPTQKYRIEPINKSKRYEWKVSNDVYLVRPK